MAAARRLGCVVDDDHTRPSRIAALIQIRRRIGTQCGSRASAFVTARRRLTGPNRDGTKVQYPGVFTRLICLLPMAPTEPLEMKGKCMVPNDTVAAKVVCLVDDDPTVLKSSGRLLASGGFTVRSFSDSRSFLTHAETHSIPLVILDIWMEKMSGLEAQLALARVSPLTRVIVITGRNDPGVKRTAMEAGAIAFFTKPFDDGDFLAAVRSALA